MIQKRPKSAGIFLIRNKNGNDTKNENNSNNAPEMDENKRKMKAMMIKKDNELMIKQIEQFNQNTNNSQTSSIVKEQLTKLNDLCDEFVIRIEAEKRELEKLERNEKSLSKDLESTKLKLVESKTKTKMTDSQIKILENRLEFNSKKLNETIWHNRKKIELIKKLKTEKKSFEDNFKKIEEDIKTKQINMAHLIEESNKEFEERDSLLKETKKKQTDLSLMQYDYKKKFSELDKILESDASMAKKIAHNERVKRKQGRRDDILRKELRGGLWKVSEKFANEVILNERISKLEGILNSISDHFMSSIPDLITSLKNKDQQLFTKFMTINRLQSELIVSKNKILPKEVEDQNKESPELVKEKLDSSRMVENWKSASQNLEKSKSQLTENLFSKNFTNAVIELAQTLNIKTNHKKNSEIIRLCSEIEWKILQTFPSLQNYNRKNFAFKKTNSLSRSANFVFPSSQKD